MKTWTLTDAQKQLIDIVEASSQEPQILATHGHPIAAVIDFTLFNELIVFQQTQQRPTIAELIEELREIQQQESIELEIPDRQDRPNSLVEMSDELCL
jgi:hypothetical protein